MMRIAPPGLPPTASLGAFGDPQERCGTGFLFDVPPLLSDLMATMGSPHGHGPSPHSSMGPGVSPHANMFSVSMDFANAALERPPCACCRLPVPVVLAGRHACQSLVIHGDPHEIGSIEDDRLPQALSRVFGREGLRAVFGCDGVVGARRLHARGMNHVFMVAHAGRLAKCVAPRAECFSEAQEAERLRRESPMLAGDEHAVFPLATYLCRSAFPMRNQQMFEVVVFEYLDNCRSVGDLVRMYERTHPCGDLQSASSCPRHRSSGTCDHVHSLRSLVVQQVARLGLRFQQLHGRRHGDLKADNVLIDRRGMPRLADFLSPFCSSCDREEFRNSIISMNPAIQDMRGAFESRWQAAQYNGELARLRQGGQALEPGEAARNAQLVESLEQLQAISQSQSIFGPVPSILGGIGITMPGFSLTLPPTAPGGADMSPVASGSSGVTPGSGRQASWHAAPPPSASLLAAAAEAKTLARVLTPSSAGSVEHPNFGWASLPATVLPSPSRGLRCPALPAMAPVERETPSSRGLAASPAAASGFGAGAFGWPPSTPLAAEASPTAGSGPPRLSLPPSWRAAAVAAAAAAAASATSPLGGGSLNAPAPGPGASWGLLFQDVAYSPHRLLA